MKKVAVALFIALVFAGCVQQAPAKTPVSAPVQVKACPASCEDNDKCTEDLCSSETNFECVNKKMVSCCGDGVCSSDESCSGCTADCGSCYTIDNLKSDVNSAYKKDVVFQNNALSAAREKYEDLKDGSYKYYSSTYITLYEITDKSKYISTPEDFEKFVRSLAEKKVSLMSSVLPAEYSGYSFSAAPEVAVIEKSSSAWLVKSSVWAELKKGSKFIDPEKSISVFVYCRPGLVAEVYSRQVQSLEAYWQNLDQTGYSSQKERFVAREISNALGDATKVSELCFQKKAAVNRPVSGDDVSLINPVSFDVKSFSVEKEYILDYDMVDGFGLYGFERKLNLKGELVNNLDESLDDVKLVLRLYNEKAKTAEVAYVSRSNLAVGTRNITLKEEGATSSSTTPYYTDIFKPISYLGLSGKSFPPASSAEVDAVFSYGVPDWDGQLYDYNVNFKSWTVGNYDVDNAELLVLRAGRVISAQEIALPQIYVRDTRFFVDQLDASYDDKGSLDAVSFTINNSGGSTDVSMPRVKVVLKELVKEGNFAQGLGRISEKELSSVELKVDSLIKIATDDSFRFSLDGLSPVALGSPTEKKGYMIYFMLYEGDALLDKKAHLITAENKMYMPTIDNPALITVLDPMAYGFTVSIDKIVLPSSSEKAKGVYVTLRSKSQTPLKNPVLDLFCGSAKMHTVGEEIKAGYDKQIFVPFDWGNCVGLTVNLREGIYQKVYGASTSSDFPAD